MYRSLVGYDLARDDTQNTYAKINLIPPKTRRRTRFIYKFGYALVGPAV